MITFIEALRKRGIEVIDFKYREASKMLKGNRPEGTFNTTLVTNQPLRPSELDDVYTMFTRRNQVDFGKTEQYGEIWETQIRILLPPKKLEEIRELLGQRTKRK